MGTKIIINRLALGDIRPYGWDENKDPSGKTESHGHEFEFVAYLRFQKFLSTGKIRSSKEKLGEDDVIEWPQKGNWGGLQVDPACTEMPLLEWKEQIRFYNVDAAGVWAYVGEYNTDMFALAPRAKTFGGFYPGIAMAGGNGWCDPWTTNIANPGMVTITNKTKPKEFDNASLAKKMSLTAHQFRPGFQTLKAILTDRPGCTKNPSGAPMAGGGGQAPLTNSSSRCRVIHFSLTFAGTGLPIIQCTQILETRNGIPTICKFVRGRMSTTQVENTNNHARWRGQLSLQNYRHPGNFNFKP